MIDKLEGNCSSSSDKITEEAKSMADRIARNLEEKMVLAKQKALAANETITSYVKENPWKSVGIGAIAGAFFALLCRRHK